MTSAPLKNDCFLHDRQRLTHSEALAILRSRIRPVVGVEQVPIERAGARILAAPAVARLPVPAHTNAAVDGFAFSFADYDAERGAELTLSGRASAGHPLLAAVKPGSATRIFTGAVMPSGLDTVAMQEDVAVSAGEEATCITVPGGLRRGANVRRAGEDVEAGRELFPAGRHLRPQDVAALASIGLGSVSCFVDLKVAIVSTGDEVVRAGARTLRPGEVYDANAPMLQALALSAGTAATDLGVWPDDAGAVRDRLAGAAREFDVILTTGGTSRGEEDHMVGAIEALGERHLWQLAIKPGRPMSFGQVGGAVVVGLPGNPVAAFVCFLMYVHPLLRALGGAPWPEPRRYAVPAAFSISDRKRGRREFWRGTLTETEGRLSVVKFPRDGSGLISGLVAADGLIEIAEDIASISAGDLVSFIPFGEFGIASG